MSDQVFLRNERKIDHTSHPLDTGSVLPKEKHLQPRNIITGSKNLVDPKEISSREISERFRRYLEEKGISPDVCGEVATHLEEFIDKSLPEIDAINTLRMLAKPIREGDYPKFSSPRGATLAQCLEWYDQHYKADVESGRLSTTQMTDIDSPFTNRLTYHLRQSRSMTLGEFLNPGAMPTVKAQMMATILSAPVEAAQAFTVKSSGGRPKAL